MKLLNQKKYSRQSLNILSRIDWTLIFILIMLAAISIFIISSAMTSEQYSTNFAQRQLLFYLFGFLIAFILMLIPFHFYKDYIWGIYAFGILSLVFLHFSPFESITPIINGAKSWYQFGFFSVQPSEFMKIIYIMALAYVISQHNKYKIEDDLSLDVKLLGKMAVVSALPMLLVLLQNDLGTTLVMVAIFFGMVLISGISWWLILPVVFVVTTVGVSLILGILYRPDLIDKLGVHAYQFDRIYSWLQPEKYVSDSGFQLMNSLISIGSGGITGRGYKDGIIYIPENHTDFIFTIVGEEFGFIGTTFVVIVLLSLLLRLFRISLLTHDSFGGYFIIGFLSLLFFHIFQNIGMTIQLVPITGLPLPFLSYGGSGLWANMVGIGIVLSIYFYEVSGKKEARFNK